MEPRFQLLNNGQQIITDDLNLLGTNAALADDRVLAELLHMSPTDGTTVSRGIIPAATFGSTFPTVASAAFVAPNGATGAVTVQPFRACIGSRVAQATNGLLNWRDIRSAISVGTVTRSVTYTDNAALRFAANSSGNPRWDLLYAAVAVEANGSTVTRKIKNPATKVIAGTAVVTTLVNTVTLGVVAGTPATTPVWPAAPADSGSTYYIPIAYVRVPNAFGAASTIPQTDIWVVANMLGASPASGNSIKLATINNQANMSTALQQSYGSTPAFVTGHNSTAPPISPGTESVILFLDMTTTTGNVLAGTTILDTSRDWSRRYFRYTALGGQAMAAFNGFPHRFPGSSTFASGGINTNSNSNNQGACGVGYSFTVSNNVAAFAESSGTNASNLVAMGAGSLCSIRVNASGQLVAVVTGTPNCQIVLWLEATGRFE